MLSIVDRNHKARDYSRRKAHERNIKTLRMMGGSAMVFLAAVLLRVIV